MAWWSTNKLIFSVIEPQPLIMGLVFFCFFGRLVIFWSSGFRFIRSSGLGLLDQLAESDRVQYFLAGKKRLHIEGWVSHIKLTLHAQPRGHPQAANSWVRRHSKNISLDRSFLKQIWWKCWTVETQQGWNPSTVKMERLDFFKIRTTVGIWIAN